MLSLVDKPIIQYGVEEAIAAGIDEIIIVTGRGKTAMEDHFDISYELDATARIARQEGVVGTQPQHLQHGTSRLCSPEGGQGSRARRAVAKELVGDEPFAVLLPDDVIDAKTSCIKQMIEVYNEEQGSVLATMDDRGAGDLRLWRPRRSPEPANEASSNCNGMVEKPKFEDAPSKQAIIGRYILTPAHLRDVGEDQPGAGGELQLTDGIKGCCSRESLWLHLRRQALTTPVTSSAC